MAISIKCWSKRYSHQLSTVAILFVAISLIFIALSGATCAAQTYLWDPDKAGTGSDDSGNWDTTSAIWSTGSTDTTWNNTTNSTNVASFGSNNGTAGTVTLQTAIWSDGLSFNAAGSGDYTIAAAAPADTLTLGGAVTVAPGLNPTISAVLAGSGGLILTGGGSLTLAGQNTYSGNTAIENGTLNVAAGSSVGNPNNSGVTLGSAGSATATNLNLLTSATMLAVGNVNAPATDTVNISPGQTLNLTNSLNVGRTGTPGAWTSQLNFTGGGNLVMNVFATISVGSNSSSVGNNVICDLSGLNEFSFFGQQGISMGSGSIATLTLAKTNSITLGAMEIGSNNSFSPVGLDTLNLGSVSNSFNMIGQGPIVIGGSNTDGTMGWLSTTPTGSLSVSALPPVMGIARAPGIIVGQGASSPTAPGTASLLLDGHSVNIYIGRLDIAEASGSVNMIGSVEFDTGTFDTSIINMSQRDSGTAISTLTLGSSPSSTGVLIVNGPNSISGGSFSLADSTTATTAANCSGTFDIKGGTAMVNCNIIVNANAATNITGGSGTILLEGGTLNMMGHNIGGFVVAQSVTLLAESGTLENVASINHTGGFTMTGTGSLTIAGANTWTGPTSVNSGTVVLAANSTLGDTAISVASGAILNMMAGSLAGDSTLAGDRATLAGTTGGATFSLEDSAIGAFTLMQGTGFSGAALTLGGDTLDFDISNLGTDEILDSGPGKASISSINIINVTTLTPTLSPGTYTLISVPSGGLIGTFEFSNSQASEAFGSYRLTLNNTSTAETLTVTAVPEPATMGLVMMSALGLLRTRRR